MFISFYKDLKKSWTFPDLKSLFDIEQWADDRLAIRDIQAFLWEEAFLCPTILAHILTCEPLHQYTYNTRDRTKADGTYTQPGNDQVHPKKKKKKVSNEFCSLKAW